MCLLLRGEIQRPHQSKFIDNVLTFYTHFHALTYSSTSPVYLVVSQQIGDARIYLHDTLIF